jgi:PHP family Zn ribbon phosphoesterase
MTDATCSHCKRRYGWYTESRPACPNCGFQEPENPEVEERIRKLTEEMLKDDSETPGDDNEIPTSMP